MRSIAGWDRISKQRAQEFARIWEQHTWQPEGEGMARIHGFMDGITLPSGAIVKHDSTSGYMAHIPEARA